MPGTYRNPAETGFYYLGSRYYDPEIGRFINADDQEIIDGGNDHILENNLFAYCFNNPVNLFDDQGYWPSWATKVLIGTAAVVVGAAAVALTGGGAAAAIPALIAGLKAAAISGAISAGTSSTFTAIESFCIGDDISTTLNKMKDSAIEAFAEGYMVGGIMAGTSQIISSGFKYAANKGAKTGRNGGLWRGDNASILSPNNRNFYESGGTLLKLGSKYRNIRFDVGANSLFHMNIQFSKKRNLHLAIGTVLSGLYGGLRK